jgi:hypothetical protein
MSPAFFSKFEYGTTKEQEFKNLTKTATMVETGPVFEQVRRVPVKLYDDEKGEKYFHLKRFTFPQQKIKKLVIRYGDDQARNKRQEGNSIVILCACPIECYLEGNSEASNMSADEYLTDKSFELPSFKIAAIRIRVYIKQKLQAQKQLSEGRGVVTLSCDVECRLEPSESVVFTDEEPGEDVVYTDEEPGEDVFSMLATAQAPMETPAAE